MSFNASDLLKLVQDFGETLTLRKVTTGGTYDASTGTVSGSATTDYSSLVIRRTVVVRWVAETIPAERWGDTISVLSYHRDSCLTEAPSFDAETGLSFGLSLKSFRKGHVMGVKIRVTSAKSAIKLSVNTAAILSCNSSAAISTSLINIITGLSKNKSNFIVLYLYVKWISVTYEKTYCIATACRSGGIKIVNIVGKV